MPYSIQVRMRAACDAGIVAGVAAGFFIPTTVSVGSCWFDGADTAASTRGLRVGASVGASPGGGDNSLTGFLGRNNSSAASHTDACGRSSLESSCRFVA
jgi:hypothetical protein